MEDILGGLQPALCVMGHDTHLYSKKIVFLRQLNDTFSSDTDACSVIVFRAVKLCLYLLTFTTTDFLHVMHLGNIAKS